MLRFNVKRIASLRRRSRARKLKNSDDYFKTGLKKYQAGHLAAALKDWDKAACLGNEHARWLLREFAGLHS